MKKIILISLFSLALASCINHRPYPTEWSSPKSIQDDICQDISGTYNDWGHTGEGATFRLTKLLFKKIKNVEPTKIKILDTVKISQPDKGIIEISLWYGDKFIHRQVFSQAKKAFTCSPEGIKWRPIYWFECTDIGVSGYGWNYIYLNKSTDGSLVVKEVGRGLGGVLLIPLIFGSDYLWYRFEPVNAGKS